MASLRGLYRLIVHKELLLATVAGSMAVLLFGADILWATVWGPNVDTHTICVEQHGNARFLGDQLQGNYATACKDNETPYEVASGQSVENLTFAVQALQTQVANLVLAPTPTPDDSAAYQAILDIIGPTGVVLPLVDLTTGNFDSGTFSTVGSNQLDFTWSEPASSFDTAPTAQGSIPVVTFNGPDESAESDFWSVGDGSSDSPFSVGVWVWLDPAGSGERTMFSKVDRTTGATEREWRLFVDNDQPRMRFWDESTGAIRDRWDSTSLIEGTWLFIASTYNGSGGHSGIDIYLDGALVDDASLTGGTYTAMENTASLVRLGFIPIGSSDTTFLQGSIAGGPCGPFFTHVQLTSTDITDLFNLCQGLMALG